MMYFKACPKCHGDMNSDRDMYGMYLRCLQCGFLKESASRNSLTTGTVVSDQQDRKAA